MKYLKLYEHKSYPSDEEISRVIVAYRKKHPTLDGIAIHDIMNLFKIPKSDLTNYDVVYDKIHNPVERHGSGLKKGEFINTHYHDMELNVSDDIEIIEDAFLDIYSGVRSVVRGKSYQAEDCYTVYIYNADGNIPKIIGIILDTSIKRLPEGYKARNVQIQVQTKTISVEIYKYHK